MLLYVLLFLTSVSCFWQETDGRTAGTTKAVADAAAYFLGKMADEGGWGEFTPRAVVALSFADRASPIKREDIELMKKHLNVQLMADVIHRRSRPTLSGLALYINALYATCQDPRSFQGVDLVSRLRLETMGSRLAFPAALLTLCIANDTADGDIHQLENMYKSNERLGFRALVIMAMVCVKHPKLAHYIKDFRENSPVEHADVYTKALYLQAANAAGLDFDRRADLRAYQLSNGTFGDMLATYSAIPALLNSSLLDVRCSTRHQEISVGKQLQGKAAKEVIYSLWISSSTGVNTHSLILKFEGDKTFYDVMRLAALRDPLYSFLFEEADGGKKVYSLAGLPNDAETGKSWILYEGRNGTVTVNSLHVFGVRTPFSVSMSVPGLSKSRRRSVPLTDEKSVRGTDLLESGKH